MLRSTITALWWPFVIPVLPRLAVSVFQFSTPAVTRHILSYIEDVSENGDAVMTHRPYTRASLIILFAVVYQGVAVSFASCIC